MKKFSMPLLAVLLVAMLLSACAPAAAPTPSLVELQATAMANAQANLALTAQAMPTDTPYPTPTAILFPTPTPFTAATQQAFITLPSPTASSYGSGGSDPASRCNVVTYNPGAVDQTIPDGTVFFEGQSFTKTWEVYNGGTCTWDTGYKLVFSNGDQMGGPSLVALTTPVAPGKLVKISVPLVADSLPGTNLTGNWRMQDDNDQYFGTYLTVVINVQEPPTPTNTQAPTNTPTVTPTP